VGVLPIRADEEKLGGIIHQAMYERLLLCDFAVAELTLAIPTFFTRCCGPSCTSWRGHGFPDANADVLRQRPRAPWGSSVSLRMARAHRQSQLVRGWYP
jgi:hypothetical protein